MAIEAAEAEPPTVRKSLQPRDDIVAATVTAGAMILFVATASATVGPALRGLLEDGGRSDPFAVTSLLLNIALILFAWKRHKEIRTTMRQRAASERRAYLLRTRDLHTELLNRRSLRERGNDLIEKADETHSNVALMVINLMRFKKVNELYGEAVGDGLLRIIAGIILRSAPAEALCARLGSDEFAVAIPFGADDESELDDFANELHSTLTSPVEIMGASLHMRTAIGVARLDSHCIDFSGLMRRADIAMRAARDDDGKRPIWFEGRMERVVRARNDIELGLKRGMSAGEFVPYYQPQVEVASGKISGFEMLARWNHPTDGLIGADTFISVAEETGLIAELSETLMRQAFEDAQAWDPELTLSVNISPRQLSDPWLASKILKLLEESGLEPERLELEITESAMVENLEVAQAVIASLKNQGVHLALDDFGTGYSSLAHLRALPFDRIKIDRSFVISLNKNPESWTIVKAIVNLGESLNVPITAEGVESGAIELRLRDLRCELGQGWFYGEPLPADETERLLADHGLLAEQVAPDPEAADRRRLRSVA
ncbi:MAG TPA: EAL domain-containing protein [Allosphingosinicella sp.]|nr:EAL domain-containing protein [Allosphingosinicella sp.]